MRMMFCFIALVCSLASFAQADAVMWQQAGSLIPAKIQQFVFSKKGPLYAGTSNGLYIFDGTDVLPVALPGIKTPDITALSEDKNETLWIGFRNGMIASCRNKKISLFNPEEGLPKTSITRIITDDQQRLWFGTQGEGIYVYQNNKLYNMNTDDGLSDNYIYDLELLNNNSIAAASDKGFSVCSFNGTKKNIKNYTTTNGLTDNIVRCISFDGSNRNMLWLGFQQGGICRFNLTAGKAEQIPVTELQNEQVNDILVADEKIYVATDNSCTELNKKGELTNIVPFTKLTSLTADNEANIWAAANGLLYKTAGEQLQLLMKLNSNTLTEIHDLLKDKNGNIWHTGKGGLVRYDSASKTIKNISLPALDRNTDVTCLFEDDKRTIWIGTMGNGIYQFNTSSNTLQKFRIIPGNESMSVLSISGRNNNLYVSSLQGIYKISSANGTYQVLNLTELSGLGISYIYHVYEDSKGRCWFATDGKGLAMMQNNSFVHYGEKNGLTSRVIYSVAEDGKGNIWCSGLNNGVFKFNGKTFSHINKTNGLPDDDISSLATDNRGNICCFSRSGLFLIDIGENIITIAAQKLTGSLNTDLNAVFADGKTVLFTGENGIFSWKVPAYKKYTRPQTFITSVSLFLAETDAANNRKFAYDENNLSFSFTGIYFSNPEKVQYQYKLDGYNNEWQLTKNKEINFPKLPAGDYTFKVRSSATDNFIAATEASYTFTIGKPFWRQWWFVLLSIAVATVFLIYVIKQREEQAKKMQQLKTEKLQSQYETLKNQVNPHFLFNSFNTLLNMIDEDPKKATAYVEHLSDFYRSIVNMREKDLIPLGDELKIIEDYFFIQKKRFGDALQFRSAISAEQKAVYSIPPLTLQLLAENAIKHNIVSKEKPLVFCLSAGQDSLVIKNNLNEKITSEPGEGLGLQNIKNRFQLIAEKEVKIEKTETDFIVQLPLIKTL